MSQVFVIIGYGNGLVSSGHQAITSASDERDLCHFMAKLMGRAKEK